MSRSKQDGEKVTNMAAATKKGREIHELRQSIERAYSNCYNTQAEPLTDFARILEYELHFQPVGPGMGMQTMNEGYQTGLLFAELAEKWCIELDFLMELVADHCRAFDEERPSSSEPTRSQCKIAEFRSLVEETCANGQHTNNTGSFGEILCHELHGMPVNPRMTQKTANNGYATGLTFKQIARKWGISPTTLGDLIAEYYLGYL